MIKPIQTFLLAALLVPLMGMSTAPSDSEKTSVEAKQAKQDKKNHFQTVKPQANIDLRYLLSKSFVVDTPETLDFVVVNRTDASDVKVWFDVTEGLLLNDAQTELGFGAADAGTENAFQVGLTPRVNGLHYLNVYASILVDGQYQTRSFAIPVSVGEYDLSKQRKPMGVVTEEPGGQRVITLPAQESSQ